MAISNTEILLKKSGVSGNTPSDLLFGELALNYADGVLFYKNSTNTISTISGSHTSNSFSTVHANGSLLIATSGSDTLTINTSGAVTIDGDGLTDTMVIGVRDASTTQNGVVQLSNSLTSTSQNTAVTSQAANTLNTLAQAAFDKANTIVVEYTTTLPNTDIFIIDSYDSTLHRGGLYDVQLSSSVGFQLVKLSVIHNDTGVFMTQYADTNTGSQLGVFDASISSGVVTLSCQAFNTNTKINFYKTLFSNV